MRRFLIPAFALAVFTFFSNATLAQRRSTLGQVCGDPTAPCKTRDAFQPFELPFDFGTNYVIAESRPFYAVILKSVKLKYNYSDCEGSIKETDRLAAQELFPRNKVFSMTCFEAAQNYYTNVAENVAFLGVYAGKTLAEANAFLSKVRATGKFNGPVVRRMRAGINGT
jgi:hypothetical protein